MKRAGQVVSLLCIVMLMAAVLTSSGAPGDDTADLIDGSERTSWVTTAQGGTLDLGSGGTVTIPPGSANRDGALRVRRADVEAPAPNPAFIPLGPAVKIDLDGANLLGDATIRMAVKRPGDRSIDNDVPIAMYFDDSQNRWVPPDTSTYDQPRQYVTARTKHFSWWGVFGWNVDWVKRTATSLVEGTFGDGGLAGSTPPNCPNRAQAEKRARFLATAGNPLSSDAVPGGDHLLWCPDVDDRGQLVLRVVSNRRMAIAVKLLAGLELVSRTSSRPSVLTYFGGRAEEYLHAQEGIPVIVLGQGDEAVLRVTELKPRAYLGTAPSAATYATDVLGIGLGLLALMLGQETPEKLSPADIEKQVVQNFTLGECVLGSLNYKSVLANPTDPAAISRSVGELVIRCAAESLADGFLTGKVQKYTINAALVISAVNIAMDVIKALTGAGEYGLDLLSGQWNYFIVAQPPLTSAEGRNGAEGTNGRRQATNVNPGKGNSGNPDPAGNEMGSSCPNGMVGPGPDSQGHSGCYVPQAQSSDPQPQLVPPAEVPPSAHPHASLDVTSGPPGTAMKATGGGFLPNKPITATESGPAGMRTVGTITSDGDGNFTMYIRVSDPTLPGPDTITFTQSGKSASVRFTITSPSGGGGSNSNQETSTTPSAGSGGTTPSFVCVVGPNGRCGN